MWKSTGLKFVAVVVSLVTVWAGINAGMKLLCDLYDGNYFFEENYADSDFVYSHYHTLSYATENILSEKLFDKYDSGMFKDSTTDVSRILSELDMAFAGEEIDYYVSIDSTVFSNVTHMTETDFAGYDYAICLTYEDTELKPVKFGAIGTRDYRMPSTVWFECLVGAREYPYVPEHDKDLLIETLVFNDINNDGTIDYEQDYDGDGVPDFYFEDVNSDGIPDFTQDINRDGIPDTLQDNDGDRIPDFYTDEEFYYDATSIPLPQPDTEIAEPAETPPNNLSDNVTQEGDETDTSLIADTVRVFVRYNSEKQESLRSEWEAYASRAVNGAKRLIGYVCVVLVTLIYLLWTCGYKNKSRDDDATPGQHVCTTIYDRMYVELNLAVLFAACAGVFACACIVAMEFDEVAGINKSFLLPALSAIGTFAWVIILACLCSALRNIKAKLFLKRSLAFILLKLCIKYTVKLIVLAFRLLAKAWKSMTECARIMSGCISKAAAHLSRAFYKKTYVAAVAIVLAYTLAIVLYSLVLFNGRYWQTGPALFFLLVFVSLAICAAVRTLSRFELLRRGVNAIKSGNTDFVITNCGNGIIAEVADGINTIGDGFRHSLEVRMKAERMKSELITNVSHDLKTPLTSIINYTKLLGEMNLTPPEANDYVKIISSKSDRLKNLTSDLFDVSKVRSGNETVNAETIDVAMLVGQVCAEHEAALGESKIDLRLNLPVNDVKIVADGKKLSRVFDNLLVNVEKYSLKGTRAYFDVLTSDGRVRCEIKNISAFPLDFDPNEITERFVRGEKSRSTEGNGLGLAIAKSYTELCGGRFSVVTDGDLFKAVIEFPLA